MHNLIAQMLGGPAAYCLRIAYARSPEIAFMAKAAGFDVIYIDLEHGTCSLDETVNICLAARALDLPALVRVTAADSPDITRLLDAGVGGIIAPHVENVATAREAVARAKFAPIGARSAAGPSLLNTYGPEPFDTFATRVNQNTLVAVMLESASAIDEAAAIAAVDGVDMLMIGAADLSIEIGRPGQTDDPAVAALIARAGEACAAAGKVLGIGGIGSPEVLARHVASGARFISAGTDSDLLVKAMRSRLSDLAQAVTDQSAHQATQPATAQHK